MKKWTNLLALALLLFCFSCNEMDKYYDNERHSTSVSVGNAWDYLSSRGNFNLFLTGVEKAGFKSLVSGTGLATIFAPTDAAFEKYLEQHNYSSLDAMDPAELSNLITYHLLYYSFTPDQFMSYNPDGAETKIDSTMLGQYYKFRTKSRDVIEDVTDPISGEKVKMFHYEKYIPVFTTNLFHTYSPTGDAKTDYERFFNGSKWNPGEDGDAEGRYFRVANAGVQVQSNGKYGIITDNGYLYVLDDVVEPLKTIHQTLEAEGYSTFLSAYDRFSDLQYDATSSLEYGGGDTLYVYNHISFPSIANEWYSKGVQGGERVNMMADNVIFAPSNEKMKDFYDKYWAASYEGKSLDSVKYLALYSLIGEQIAQGMKPIFPSNFNETNPASPFAVKTAISNTLVTADKLDRCIYCSNGIVYGVTDLVAEPKYFHYITAPAYIYPNYYMFLLLMDKARLTDTYLTTGATFYAFYPGDEIMRKTPSPEDTYLQYQKSSNKFGGEDIVYRGEDGALFPVSSSYAARIVRNHICDACFEVSPDEKVYRTTFQTFNYIYCKGDSIFSSALYNQHHGKINMFDGSMPENCLTFKEIKTQTPGEVPDRIENGYVYALSGESDAAALLPEATAFQDNDNMKFAMPTEITEGDSTAINFWNEGMRQSIDSTRHLNVFNTMIKEGVAGRLPRFIVFALSRDAVQNARSANIYRKRSGFAYVNRFMYYMPNLFVSVQRSGLLDYPFPGDGNLSRVLQTYKTTPEGGYTNIYLTQKQEADGWHLYAAGTKDKETGREVRVKNTFPYIYSDCAVYILEDYLDFGEYNLSEEN